MGQPIPRVYNDAGILIERGCSMCRQILSVSDFNKHKLHKDGYNNACRSCANKRWHEKIGERRIPYLLARCKATAKKNNIPFDLTVDDLIIPTHCPILGIPLVFGKNGNEKTWRENSPSVDRIVPSLGYIKGNIIIVSYRANRIKNDATVQELRSIADFYEQLH